MNPPETTAESFAAAIDQDANTNGEPLPTPLRFEAGKGDEHKQTHGAIETVLESAGFSPEEIRAIYFGNWLRDYSQLLDPKIVRATNMPKSFPDLLSREALTRIVDVLAVKEFTDLMKIDRPRFVVTPERLGVYRPAEHIDNPKAINPNPVNPKERDADFDDWVLPDDPALNVDYDTSMKRYIQRSADLMATGLESAAKAGQGSTEGLRDMGAALHILEDFFAHSNFAELSLIKLGHTHVLPWTSTADCKHQLPLVTGTFGGSDIIASLAEPLGNILFSPDDKPFEALKAGERYERDQIIQIILGEHPDEKLLEGYEAFLRARDQWASQPFSEQVEQFYAFIATPGRLLGNAFGIAMQSLAVWLGNSVDDLQTLLDEDPNTSGSTDPSHSQLAKDHAQHPLHQLAALLARNAVLQVGQAVLSDWHGKEGAEGPAHVAARFFTHPMDSDWQDVIVREWAEANPEQVERAALKSELNQYQADLQGNAKRDIQRFSQDSSTFSSVFFESTSLSDLWARITGK
ncbi:PhcA [Pseudomonas syringae CC1557]|uniref:PhcA n=1 Tax=Pseudomonas syringae CC1557 TaxID=1357279 RepID=W0MQF1_PSESX|nr:HET-C-related protein [Pseudomonas syringae]AHG39450.1 PhcA [Pseudomonas syringae CC1557]